MSRAFKKLGVAGRKNPRWSGGKTTEDDGRVLVYCPEHPRPSKGRYVYRYRRKIEIKIGRFLFPNEVVHHKDGDPTNDRISNLQLLSPSQHSSLHAKIWKTKWSRNHTECVNCHTTTFKHKGRGLCCKCYESKRIR